MKAHDNANKLIKDNELCEMMLKQVSDSNQIQDCTVNHFNKIKPKDLLGAFVKVRQFSNLYDPAIRNLTTKKGKPTDFDHVSPLTTLSCDGPNLLESAFGLRDKQVIAALPPVPTIPNPTEK
jgi:hypothetical protein